MKKRCFMIVAGLVACLALTGCGATDPGTPEENAQAESSVADTAEEDDAITEYDIVSIKSDIAAIKADIAELEEAQTSDAAAENVPPSDENETTVEAEADKPYKDGAPAGIIEDENVVDYYINLDDDQLTVITRTGVDRYTGGETPDCSWEVEGITDKSYIWWFEEAGSSCLLTRDAVVALLPDGETSVFLDHVVGYGGWDGLIAVYQLKDGVLSHYEQDSAREICQYTIDKGVSGATVVPNDTVVYQKNGTVYSFSPYDHADDVANEDANFSNSNRARLIAGDTSVIECLGDV